MSDPTAKEVIIEFLLQTIIIAFEKISNEINYYEDLLLDSYLYSTQTADLLNSDFHVPDWLSNLQVLNKVLEHFSPSKRQALVEKYPESLLYHFAKYGSVEKFLLLLTIHPKAERLTAISKSGSTSQSAFEAIGEKVNAAIWQEIMSLLPETDQLTATGLLLAQY